LSKIVFTRNKVGGAKEVGQGSKDVDQN